MDLRDSFRRPAGIAGWVLLGVQVVIQALDWLSRTEFVTEKYRTYFPDGLAMPDSIQSVTSFLSGDLARWGVVVIGLLLIARGARQNAQGFGTDTHLDVLEWRDGNSADSRVEYRNWAYVVFRIGGHRKERVRAYLDIDDGGTENRTAACISGHGWFAHEVGDIRPGEQYAVWVFLRLRNGTELWIDRKKQHILGYRPRYLDAGCYVTDRPFMDEVHRQRLPAGRYRIKAVLITGDVAHQKEWPTDAKSFDVA